MAYIQKIIVTIGRDVIELLKSGSFRVKGKTVNSPFNGKGVSVRAVGNTIILKTSFGLEVRYQGPSNVYIYLNSRFSEKVTGL